MTDELNMGSAKKKYGIDHSLLVESSMRQMWISKIRERTDDKEILRCCREMWKSNEKEQTELKGRYE